MNTSAIAVSPSTAQPDSQFVVDRAELLPDEHLAMTPSSDMPMREGWRDGPGGCLMCGATTAFDTRAVLHARLPATQLSTPSSTSHRRFDQCAQSSPARKVLVAHTIYECGRCGERFLGERRCGDCNVFARAVGLGGVCPECDTPLLIEDLLGEGVLPTT